MAQLLHLLERAREWLRQLLVLLRDLEHELLVRDLLLLHLRHLLLEAADEVEVVVRDVVVVVLDLAEGLLVLLHQLVDVVVLALLNLQNLHLAPQLQVVAQQLHLLLVPVDPLISRQLAASQPLISR